MTKKVKLDDRNRLIRHQQPQSVPSELCPAHTVAYIPQSLVPYAHEEQGIAGREGRGGRMDARQRRNGLLDREYPGLGRRWVSNQYFKYVVGLHVKRQI